MVTQHQMNILRDFIARSRNESPGAKKILDDLLDQSDFLRKEVRLTTNFLGVDKSEELEGVFNGIRGIMSGQNDAISLNSLLELIQSPMWFRASLSGNFLEVSLVFPGSSSGAEQVFGQDDSLCRGFSLDIDSLGPS